MSATHGKLAAVYRLRPKGFKGSGLSDVTWGAAFSGAASAHYEVAIMTLGTPDKYKWRKNGGAWDDNTGAGYSITGAAQTLDDGQQITFAATTGHTLADQWFIGNFKDEACTESGVEAQITEATRRILNPNSEPTFTDSGGANVIRIDHAAGRAVFDANVATVDVDGNNGYILQSGLQKVGYLFDWNFDANVELAEITAYQEKWKKWLPGQAGGDGGCEGYFANSAWFDDLKLIAGGTQEHFFLQLFTYDPDDDQTGDHFNAWVQFKDLSIKAPQGDIVKEAIGFTLFGLPVFVANV